MSTWSFVKFVNVSLVFARVGIWQILRLQNSSHLNDYLRVLGIANRILLVVHFYIASIYIQSLIILPLMTSSLYRIFIAHHGKLLMCGILSSSLFRCHVELWCTNRSLFRVIFFFCSNPISLSMFLLMERVKSLDFRQFLWINAAWNRQATVENICLLMAGVKG